MPEVPEEVRDAVIKGNLKARGQSIDRIRKKDLNRPAAKWISKNRLSRGMGEALAIVLTTSGCTHARSDSGGCIMCSYLLDGSAEKPTAEQLIEQFQSAQSELKEKAPPLAVKLYTSGSFLDPEEVPMEARDEILRMIRADERVSDVVIESRPEFVTDATMSVIHSFLENCHVEIGVGLESANDEIRSLCINKGFSKNEFERAVKVAKKHDIGVRAYVLLKPPFLTEHAALQDCFETMVYAAKTGVTTISVNPVNIQKHTLVEQLWTRGQYRPPWLWTLIECLKRARAEIDKAIPIICDPVAPGRARGVHNCGSCDSKITDAIRKFSLEQHSDLFSELECGCVNLWHHTLEHEDFSLLVHTHRLEG